MQSTPLKALHKQNERQRIPFVFVDFDFDMMMRVQGACVFCIDNPTTCAHDNKNARTIGATATAIATATPRSHMRRVLQRHGRARVPA
jgi:hypothetical protein